MSELPKIVLRRLAIPAAGEHPTPDLLAAFVEQQLAGAERENLLAHLAACDQCRQVLWRTVPQPEAQPAAIKVAGAARWRIPAWRWVGAAAAVLVIATVALFYRGGPGAAGEKVASSVATSVRLPAPLPSTPAAADLQASNSGANVASEARQMAAPKPQSDRVLSAASAPAPAWTAKAGVVIASGIMAPAIGKKKLAPPTRWMLSPRGALLRSTDAGQSWQTVPFAGDVAFRTIAVVGSSVWAGGNGGVLDYSPDGSQWTRLGPAATAPLNQDLHTLIFKDALHGTLTTASGQTWVTSDSGRSWQKQ